MSSPSAPQLTWLDSLRVDDPPVGVDDLLDTAAVSTARAVLPEPVVAWALVTAARVSDDVEELRQSESIVIRKQTRRVERLACAAGVLTTLVSLRSGVPVEQAPDEMRRQARAAFHQGADLPSIIRFVWSHHARFQEKLLLVQRTLAPAQDSGAELQDLHTRMHQILDAYISAVDVEFRHEQDRWQGGRPAQRRALLEEVLAGEQRPYDPENRLGIRLTGRYVFAWVGTLGGVMDEAQNERLRLLREQAGHQLGATGGFSQDFGDGDILWCLTFPPSPRGEKDNPLKRIRLPSDLRLDVGPVAQGAGELFRSLMGAAEARRISRHPARLVAERGSADLVFHEDIRVLSVLTRSEAELADFVDRVLGDLARNTPKNADLRRTLLLYLLHGRSRKEAATVLHISPNTVAYRVGQARELVGDDFPEASVEVLVALHVLDILPGIVTAGDQ